MTKRINRVYTIMLLTLLVLGQLTTPGYAVEDMWTVANTIIVDVYAKIAGISTVLAGLMSAVAVVGAKISNNQHKVDQAWDWLKRIWIAWAIINGIGAFIAYVAPFFSGLAILVLGFLCDFLRPFVLIFAVVVLQVRRFVLRLVNLEVITGTAADQHHGPHQKQGEQAAVRFFRLGLGFRFRHILHGFGRLRLRFGGHFLGWFLALFGKRQKVIQSMG
mgnify:CR=1 FL=1